MGCSVTGSFTLNSWSPLAVPQFPLLTFQLTRVTPSHLSPQEDFTNACQGICSYKGLTKC